MSESIDDLLRYRGQVLPKSFNPGFIAMSYVVSLIGAACTLELLNRRTSHKGIFNHLLLLGSAVSMGGIAIWCMHFIGNRAVRLGERGEPELQIAYSSSFTALSFFVPIIALLAAFIAVGANSKVSWWRVTIGGVLAGAAICGMHYLGDRSIENYVCIYSPAHVVGSAVIAVAACITSLSLFFVFRASWTNAWWKRIACAVILAGAVSGMHWTAATGVRYRLVTLITSKNELSRNMTVIIVICLSVVACCIMAGLAIYTARLSRRYAQKAQQVILAAAVFDQDRRILVNPDGLLPSEKVTDSFFERNAHDTFSIGHSLFHWMFVASRHWADISPLVSGMRVHLSQLPRASLSDAVEEKKETASDDDLVLREMFCVAAAELADKTKESLASVGRLWDDILPTGGDPRRAAGKDDSDFTEKDMQKRRFEYGRGSLMFLVRHVRDARDVARLESAGYRFAELHQVGGIIRSSMQIRCWDFEAKLQSMAASIDEGSLEPGVHLGFFGIRARVGIYGFDVLVRRRARNLLPSVRLPIAHLDTWHLEYLQQLDGMSVSQVLRRLPERASSFSKQLQEAVESLRELINAPIFDEAVLSSKVVTLAGRNDGSSADEQVAETCMIVFHIVIDIHLPVANDDCELVPLSFFKVRQVAAGGEPSHLAFAQSLHREFAPMSKLASRVAVTEDDTPTSSRDSPLSTRLRRFGRHHHRHRTSRAVDGEGNLIPTTLRQVSSINGSEGTGSTLKLWPGRRSSDNRSASTSVMDAPSMSMSHEGQHGTKFGGIMVSEEIRVEVHDAGGGQVSPTAHADSSRVPPQNPSAGTQEEHGSSQAVGLVEMLTLQPAGNAAVHTGAAGVVSNIEVERGGVRTFVDELFALCINER